MPWQVYFMLLGRGADNAECSIELKTFHSSILNDHEALRKEEEGYTQIPPVRKLDNGMIGQNLTQIRRDVQEIIYGWTSFWMIPL